MSVTSVQQGQVEKQQFRNDSGGFIGVVKVDAKGQESGAAVAPGATVWLSEVEKMLTANAPREEKDNPFLPQEQRQIDHDTGQPVQVTVTPLVPVSDRRWVPLTDRFIPPPEGEEPLPGAPTSAPPPSAPEDVGVHTPDGPLNPTPPPGVPSAPIPSPTPDPPDEQDIPGAVPRPGPGTEPPASSDSSSAAPAAEPAAPAPAEGEETAVQVDPKVGEETGSAVPPGQPPPEGSYRAGEEVGTPDAPASKPNGAAAGPPAPFSPGSAEG